MVLSLFFYRRGGSKPRCGWHLFFFQKVPGKLEEPLIANAIWGEKNTLGFWVDGHKYRYYMILLTETTTHTLKFRISKWKRNCRFRMHQ